MPNIMIHEEVGRYIGNKLNINSYDYYLGILAPDSPNLEGFGPKEERWTAHKRKKDYNDWRNNLNDFYLKEKDNYNKDFILGYYIHVLTDIVFDDYLYINVREKILNDGYKLEESHQILVDDYDKYYFKEIEEIKNILRSSNKSYGINNISSDKLLKWKNKSINSFVSSNQSKYISSDVINFLNAEVYRELTDFIS